MVIVDSSVWIDYYNGTDNAYTSWLEREIERNRIALTDLILCEVLQGTRSDATFAERVEELSRFEIFNTGGEELAVLSARNHRRLRAMGITVRTTVDCMIGTFCLSEGHALLHRDRDFDAFEEHLGLRVVRPSLQ